MASSNKAKLNGPKLSIHSYCESRSSNEEPFVMRESEISPRERLRPESFLYVDIRLISSMRCRTVTVEFEFETVKRPRSVELKSAGQFMVSVCKSSPIRTPKSITQLFTVVPEFVSHLRLISLFEFKRKLFNSIVETAVQFEGESDTLIWSESDVISIVSKVPKIETARPSAWMLFNIKIPSRLDKSIRESPFNPESELSEPKQPAMKTQKTSEENFLESITNFISRLGEKQYDLK